MGRGERFIGGIDLAVIGRETIAATRQVGVVVLGLGLLGLAVLAMQRQGRVIMVLGHRGMVEHGRFLGLPSGFLLVAVAVGALAVNFSIEQEVRSGPNRMIDAAEAAAGDDRSVLWALEPGTRHFMNNSSLPLSQLEIGIATIAKRGGAAIPFLVDLRDVDSPDRMQTSLIVRVPMIIGEINPLLPLVTPDAACQTSSGRCTIASGELIGDDEPGFAIGTDVLVGDHPHRIVAHATEPQSLINRLVFYGAFDPQPDTNVHGLAIIVPSELADPAGVAQIQLDLGPGVEVRTTDQVLASNVTFWSGNVTALTLLLTLITMGFAGAAIFGHRRSTHQMVRRARGAARAAGLTLRGEGAMLITGAVSSAVLGGLIAWPVAAVLVQVANRSVPGFTAQLTASMVAAAAGAVLFVEFVALAMLMTNSRNESVADLTRE